MKLWEAFLSIDPFHTSARASMSPVQPQMGLLLLVRGFFAPPAGAKVPPGVRVVDRLVILPAAVAGMLIAFGKIAVLQSGFTTVRGRIPEAAFLADTLRVTLLSPVVGPDVTGCAVAVTPGPKLYFAAISRLVPFTITSKALPSVGTMIGFGSLLASVTPVTVKESVHCHQ